MKVWRVSNSKYFIKNYFRYIDKAVKDKDSNELDNLGLTKQQQEYLFYETKEFEGCYYLEEEYTKCMDRFKVRIMCYLVENENFWNNYVLKKHFSQVIFIIFPHNTKNSKFWIQKDTHKKIGI